LRRWGEGRSKDQQCLRLDRRTCIGEKGDFRSTETKGDAGIKTGRDQYLHNRLCGGEGTRTRIRYEVSYRGGEENKKRSSNTTSRNEIPASQKKKKETKTMGKGGMRSTTKAAKPCMAEEKGIDVQSTGHLAGEGRNSHLSQ